MILRKSKYNFEVKIRNSKASFKKNPRKTIQQRKTARMSYISFWVHWLVDHAPKIYLKSIYQTWAADSKTP